MNDAGCPDANAIARFLEGRPAPEIEAHLASCRACLDQVIELRTLQQSPAVLPPPALAAWAKGLGVPPRSRWKATRWAALAAAALPLSYSGFRLGEETYLRSEAAEESFSDGNERAMGDLR